MNRLLAPLAIAAATLLAAAPAHAQLAGRTISIIVPQPAGNPTDGVARKLQPLLQKELDQTVIVENTPVRAAPSVCRRCSAARPTPCRC